MFRKTIQILQISLLIVVFSLYNFFVYVYNPNGPVVRALDFKFNDQSSNLTKTLKKIFLPGNILLFFDPSIY
jgi:hypothetical protein